MKEIYCYKESERKKTEIREWNRGRKWEPFPPKEPFPLSQRKEERKRWKGTFAVAGRHAVIKESSCCSVSQRDSMVGLGVAAGVRWEAPVLRWAALCCAALCSVWLREQRRTSVLIEAKVCVCACANRLTPSWECTHSQPLAHVWPDDQNAWPCFPTLSNASC